MALTSTSLFPPQGSEEEGTAWLGWGFWLLSARGRYYSGGLRVGLYEWT